MRLAERCRKIARALAARTGMLAFVLFPAYLIIFSYHSIGLRIGVHYVADVVTFCTGFYFIGLVVLSWRAPLVRAMSMGLVCGVLIAFHWTNLLFFDFFWDWLPFDSVWLIPDLRDVSSGIPKLYTSADVVWGLLLPALLALGTLRFRPARTRAVPLVVGCLVVPFLAFDLGASSSRFDDAEPFMTFLRQGVAEFVEHYFGKTDYRGLLTRRDNVLPLGSDGYRYADPAKGLLLKLPHNGPTGGASPDHRLNVVLVVMESFRAYESGTYGAHPSFTPSLDQLARSALVFRNFYANGVQTARGEFSLLASQYDNLGGSPDYVLYPFTHLTTLPSILKEYGYHTSQIQAYNGDFENMRLFLTRHGVDRVYDWNDMPPGQTLGWGLNDVSMFDRAIEIIGAQAQPFFAEILTLSNHFPFDSYPTDAQCPVADGGASYVAYSRGICYTDHALGHFMEVARRQPWYADTLFVFTADHGLFLFPDQPPLSQVQRQEAAFRIPLLIYAPGRVVPGERRVVGSQVDVAPTVLELLGIRHAHTFLGRSLLDERVAPEDRFAMFLQQNNWFLRRGNRYYYCGNPHDEDGPALDFTRGYREAFRAERTALGFETQGDLLESQAGDTMLLDRDEVRSRRRWGQDVLDLARLAIRHDWVMMDKPPAEILQAGLVNSLAPAPAPE